MIRKRNPSKDDRAIFGLIRRELIPLNPPELQFGDHSDRQLLKRLKRGITYVWSSSGTEPASAFITFIPRGSTMFVDLLAVHPKLRGSGVGSALMKKAEWHAWSLGCRRVQLYVNESNMTGLRFYMKNRMSVVRYETILRSYLMDKPIG
ncbi:GNAT family N-acetyltransferase [Paenibacillus alkalitolerans]|uniref:GNAT family N-acetyltransferase n=1 Tax=Paenibacillus alkalitolerans TaxID=2799335 RepID=UPI0018F3AE5C|nr:GNAT family N-acetyltransferase [Paenibacillus alkalitolerans]